MMSLLDREEGDTIDIDFEDLYCGLYDQDVHQDGLYDQDIHQDGLYDQDVHQDGLGDDFLQHNWGNSVIEDSLETIRNVLATANIPADNRKSLNEILCLTPNFKGLKGRSSHEIRILIEEES